MEERYLDLLFRLIRVGAVSSDITKVNESVRIMGEFLRANGVPVVQEEQLPDGRLSLYAASRPGKVQPLLLCCHLDVVPPLADDDFEPRIEGDKIYGRGSGDDLGNAIAAVAALVELCQQENPPGCAILFSTDEEVGGSSVCYMSELGYRASKLAIVVDGPYNSIVSAEKGMVVFQVVATGVACHASVGWTGKNAAAMLIRDCMRLQQRFETEWPQATGEDLWHLTMEICQLNAGMVSNQVPGEARAVVNVRYTAMEELEHFMKMVHSTLQECQVEMDNSHSCLPVYCSEDDPQMRMLQEEWQRVRPDSKCGFVRMCGATDARHMVGWQVPIAITGIYGVNAHGTPEYAYLHTIDEVRQWFLGVGKRIG